MSRADTTYPPSYSQAQKQPAQPQPSTPIIINQAGQPPIIIQPSYVQANPIYSSKPQHCLCPHCKQEVQTKVQYKVGLGTWAIAGSICVSGLFFLVCLFGCQLIPFCIDACKDAEHYCPNCQKLIGVKKLIS